MEFDRAVPRQERPAESDEKRFYLDEFRGRTLLLSLASGATLPRDDFLALQRVLEELAANETRIILCIGVPVAEETRQAVCALAQRLAELVEGEGFLPLMPQGTLAEAPVCTVPEDLTVGTSLLARVWLVLRRQPLFVALVPCRQPHDWIYFAERLATQLRVHKWVMIDQQGGIRDPGGEMLSFMDATLLETLLAEGQAEWAGLGARRPVFAAAHRALVGGTGSVNLCDLAGLEQELFTYTGAGTLFTLSDYCAVKRLGIDDYAEVERLLFRGEREGVLKPRTTEEIARVLVQGYGATVGGRHLAGVCSLETERYQAERAGEVVALYTITRFKGEGIGRKLLARLTADARAQGLHYLFACTTLPNARAFFEREGFRLVSPEDVPAEKWRDYDAVRRAQVMVLRKDLEPLSEAPVGALERGL